MGPNFQATLGGRFLVCIVRQGHTMGGAVHRAEMVVFLCVHHMGNLLGFTIGSGLTNIPSIAFCMQFFPCGASLCLQCVILQRCCHMSVTLFWEGESQYQNWVLFVSVANVQTLPNSSPETLHFIS